MLKKPSHHRSTFRRRWAQLALALLWTVDLGVHFHVRALQFSFPNFGDALTNITLVREGSWYTNLGYTGSFLNATNGAVVLNALTNTSRMGRMVYTQPLNLLHPRTRNAISFDTSFTFQIITNYVNRSRCGSGLIFAITDFLQSPAESSGDRLGLVNAVTYNTTNSFFAVEFDTYLNDDYYTVDPSNSHVGFDIGNLFSAVIADTRGIPSLNLYANYTFACWLHYNSSTHLIRFWMTNSSTPTRPTTPLLQLQYDLSPVTAASMYVGFTGLNYGCGSGDQYSAVFSWDFNSDLDEDLLSVEVPAPATTPVGMPSIGGGGGLKIWHLVVIIVPVIIVVCGGICIIWIICKRCKPMAAAPRAQLPQRNSSAAAVAGEQGFQMVKYEDVLQATQGFAENNKIGEGLSGIVYRGVMPNGTIMAMKRLRDTGLQKQKEFFDEMALISKMKHRNLLELKGWSCHESGEAVLIFDYMRNGSLDSYLFGKRQGNTSRVSAAEEGRVKMRIVRGVAAALEYLHWGTERCVIHRDVKAANVLLTEEMEAKLGDFGLARVVDQNRSRAMTLAMGTPGYVAPEVPKAGERITAKSDVYSFGVLMLEVACGRRAILSGGGFHIIKWVSDMVGRGMALEYFKEVGIPAEEWDAWGRVLKLALACCSETPAKRPSMKEVNSTLGEISVQYILN